MTTVPFPLPDGKSTWINEDDVALVSPYCWRVSQSNRTFYAYTYIDGKRVTMQNLILPPPLGKVVDHKDRDGLNNRRSNLRYATAQQNTWNRRKPHHSKSPYKGVSYRRDSKRWVAQISVGRKKLILGLFLTAEEAARVYDAKARELRGEFAVTNFPE